MKQAYDPHTVHSTILQKEGEKKQCPSTIQHMNNMQATVRAQHTNNGLLATLL